MEVAMTEYTKLIISEDYISISFDAGNEDIQIIGSKMNEICDAAYMNGYNWDAFFNCYLGQNAPEIFDVIESDPEAEMYSVYIEDINSETKALAEQLVEIIDDLLNDEEKILSFVKANADDIEWD
jgi:hypothetical protein